MTDHDDDADTTPPGTELVQRAAASGARCDACGAPRSDHARFCEGCGRPLPAPGGPDATLTLTVMTDADQFARTAADGLRFPGPRPDRVLTFEAGVAVIGRCSATRPDPCDVDLSGELSDPGVSHRHASVVRRPDGTTHVVDLGSTNGTTLDDDPTPLPAGTPVEVRDGTRVHVGAWTTIVVGSRRVAREHTGSGPFPT